MPDKLTDKEIVKALECCMDEMGCTKGCPCFNPKAKGSHCTVAKKLELEKLTLDLINRQQAELDEYEKIKTTIDEFWEILLTLSIFKRKEKPTLEEFAEAIQEIKAEAYKEFAEKFKKKLSQKYTTSLWKVYCEEIDNTLKELVGEDNGDTESRRNGNASE